VTLAVRYARKSCSDGPEKYVESLHFATSKCLTTAAPKLTRCYLKQLRHFQLSRAQRYKYKSSSTCTNITVPPTSGCYSFYERHRTHYPLVSTRTARGSINANVSCTVKGSDRGEVCPASPILVRGRQLGFYFIEHLQSRTPHESNTCPTDTYWLLIHR
jgi:hypothetical protein